MIRILLMLVVLSTLACSPLSVRKLENINFRKADPVLGGTFPAHKIYDQEGKPFVLPTESGRYTVLVFGCLT